MNLGPLYQLLLSPNSRLTDYNEAGYRFQIDIPPLDIYLLAKVDEDQIEYYLLGPENIPEVRLDFKIHSNLDTALFLAKITQEIWR